jgi:hypothetical protein
LFFSTAGRWRPATKLHHGLWRDANSNFRGWVRVNSPGLAVHHSVLAAQHSVLAAQHSVLAAQHSGGLKSVGRSAKMREESTSAPLASLRLKQDLPAWTVHTANMK